MEYVYIGKIVNTHGIKGELRIKSNFKYKNLIFKIDNELYVGNNKEKKVIKSYRIHKEYDMVIFVNYNDINQVIKYKGQNVYFNKQDLILNNNIYLNDDLIGFSILFKDKEVGKVKEIYDAGNGNEIIDLGNIKIPNNNNFVDKIEISNKKIYVKNIEGLM